MSSLALFEQALSFYREPTRYRELKDPQVPLAGESGPLLRLASGMAPQALGVPPGVASADEWQAAARFFVQQVLLAPGADFYRLHGLAPQARAEEIKEHHRLLMRLVHPDRERTDDAWQTAAAARINQAYATLRDPDRRAQYDRQRQAVARHADAVPAMPHAGPHARWPGAARRSGDTPLARYLWRHLPQVSLAATALLAVAWVGWIWLSNPRSAALGSSGDGGTIAPAQPVAAAGSADERGTAGLEASAPQHAPASASVGAVSTPILASAALVRSSPAAAANPPAEGASRPRPPSFRAAPPAAPAAPSSAETVRGASIDLPQAAQQAPRVEPVPESQAAFDPGSVISPLVWHYERGDLDRFMALFHESARSEAGSRARIRRDYEELFAATSSRQLIVWDMRWQPRDDTWSGEGRFQARVQRIGENFHRLYSGTLAIEVGADGGRPLIRGLFHRLSTPGD